MSHSLKQLRELTDDALVEAYDREAKSTTTSLNLYREELFRREQQRQTESMLRYTVWIIIMTAIMTIATIVNVIVAFKMLK